MKTQIKIENCETPYCVIHTASETQGIKDIAEKISRMDQTGRNTILNGWDGDYFIQVKQTSTASTAWTKKCIWMQLQTARKKPCL